MALWEKIALQFGNPTGTLGKVAGFIMAHRKSNIERNNWAIDLLSLEGSDNVLETGFGPGLVISRLSEIITSGVVCGIDQSKIMYDQAMKRNQNGIASGRVRLYLGSISEMPTFEVKFDKVLDINSFQFWPNQVDCLVNLKRQMTNGGMMAIVHQPRKPGAKDKDTEAAGKWLSKAMQNAGFKQIRVEKRIMKPVSTICLLGINEL